jgi:hypothetical protein
MASIIPKTWGEFRTVYGSNGFYYSIGDGNLIFEAGVGVGIHPSPPCSVLFRSTLFNRLIFQIQPWFSITENSQEFLLEASLAYGGLIPDKEWSYFRGKTVSNAGTSFAITDDAQQNYTTQSVPDSFPPIISIEGFTAF